MSRFRVCLVNMPWAALGSPSLALTQLQSALRQSRREPVTVEIFEFFEHNDLHRVPLRGRYDVHDNPSSDGLQSTLQPFETVRRVFPPWFQDGTTYLRMRVDASGRHVATLESDRRTDRMVWDGRDMRGRPLPEGMYFFRSEGSGARGRVALIR